MPALKSNFEDQFSSSLIFLLLITASPTSIAARHAILRPIHESQPASDGIGDLAGNLRDAALLVGDRKINLPIAGRSLGRDDQGVDAVLHVSDGAELGPIPEDGDVLALQGEAYEEIDEPEFRAPDIGSGSIGIGQPDHRGPHLVRMSVDEDIFFGGGLYK